MIVQVLDFCFPSGITRISSRLPNSIWTILSYCKHLGSVPGDEALCVCVHAHMRAFLIHEINKGEDGPKSPKRHITSVPAPPQDLTLSGHLTSISSFHRIKRSDKDKMSPATLLEGLGPKARCASKIRGEDRAGQPAQPALLRGPPQDKPMTTMARTCFPGTEIVCKGGERGPTATHCFSTGIVGKNNNESINNFLPLFKS